MTLDCSIHSLQVFQLHLDSHFQLPWFKVWDFLPLHCRCPLQPSQLFKHFGNYAVQVCAIIEILQGPWEGSWWGMQVMIRSKVFMVHGSAADRCPMLVQ